MKKIFLALFFLTGLSLDIGAGSGRLRESAGDLGPASQASLLIGTTSYNTITLSASGAGTRNCLDFFVAFSSNIYTAYVLDGNTTNYTLTYPANTVLDKNFFPEFCGSLNTAMTLKVTAAVSSTTATINYKGFVGR